MDTEGDEEFFSDVWNTYSDGCFIRLRRYVGNDIDTRNDIVVDTFLALKENQFFNRHIDFEFLERLIFRILKNRVIDYLRKKNAKKRKCRNTEYYDNLEDIRPDTIFDRMRYKNEIISVALLMSFVVAEQGFKSIGKRGLSYYHFNKCKSLTPYSDLEDRYKDYCEFRFDQKISWDRVTPLVCTQTEKDKIDYNRRSFKKRYLENYKAYRDLVSEVIDDHECSVGTFFRNIEKESNFYDGFYKKDFNDPHSANPHLLGICMKNRVDYINNYGEFFEPVFDSCFKFYEEGGEFVYPNGGLDIGSFFNADLDEEKGIFRGNSYTSMMPLIDLYAEVYSRDIEDELLLESYDGDLVKTFDHSGDSTLDESCFDIDVLDEEYGFSNMKVNSCFLPSWVKETG